jgi:hypothetical protein
MSYCLFTCSFSDGIHDEIDKSPSTMLAPSTGLATDQAIQPSSAPISSTPSTSAGSNGDVQAQALDATTTRPLEIISNSEKIGQSRPLTKRAKVGLAVVGKGLTDK